MGEGFFEFAAGIKGNLQALYNRFLPNDLPEEFGA
jgi:hypothetical protein